MRNSKTAYITRAAMIAAVYVVLTVLFAPVSFGNIQLRFAEALTILPYFTPAAIPGLFVGCLLGNILGGAVIWDVIFGSLATLIGAVFSYLLRKYKFLVSLPPVAANVLIVPFVLRYAYGIDLPIGIMMATVGAGEVLSCTVLGTILLLVLERYHGVLFRKGE